MKLTARCLADLLTLRHFGDELRTGAARAGDYVALAHLYEDFYRCHGLSFDTASREASTFSRRTYDSRFPKGRHA